MNKAGTLSVVGNTFGCGNYRKPKKKRHRSKLRSSLVRKNRQKKFYSKKKTNINKFNSFKFNSETAKIMSNWYWSNYKKAVEWQERHKLAHWKACALALMEENRCLMEIINNMRPEMVSDVSVTPNLGEGINPFKTEMKVNPNDSSTNVHVSGARILSDNTEEEECGRDDYNNPEDTDDDDDDDDDDDIEFEMSEEMIQFFEQSYKHKMDLKKLREKELLNKVEEEIKQMQTNKIKRSTEMNLLYGEGASMIIGMETAVQLSFDKYCDTKSPKYWPNIPFRL